MLVWSASHTGTGAVDRTKWLGAFHGDLRLADYRCGETGDDRGEDDEFVKRHSH